MGRKVIDLDLLWHIADKYQIPKDIRAHKAIEEYAIDLPPATPWHRPAACVPTHTDAVLTAIDGQIGPHEMHNAYCIGRFISGCGWSLDATDSDCIEFTVKAWRELPDLPEDLGEECRRLLHE